MNSSDEYGAGIVRDKVSVQRALTDVLGTCSIYTVAPIAEY